MADLPTLPTGFSQSGPSVSGNGLSQSLLKGLDLTLSLSTIYDSNVTLGSNDGVVPEESDWLTTPSLKGSYLWGGGDWQVGVRGEVSRNHYHDRDDFRNTNYGAYVFGGYQSGKIYTAFDLGFRSIGAINQIAGGFIEQDSFTTALSAKYRLSKKTSLGASWNSNSIEADTEGFADTYSGTFGLIGLWGASSKLTVGPGFRYGVRSGADDEDFAVYGPSLSANYKLSSKVNFRSSVGFDWTDSPYTGSDTYANWLIALEYQASTVWGIDFQTIRDTQAAIGAGGGFDLVSSYRLTYWRKIRKLRAALGVSYSERRPTDDLATTAGFRDGDFISFSADFSYPVYKDEGTVIFSLNWSDQSTEDVVNSWDRFQTGLGLEWVF